MNSLESVLSIGGISAIFVLSRSMLSACSRWNKTIKTELQVEIRKKVDVGEVAARPAKAVAGKIFSRCGDGEKFSAPWIKGGRSGHFSGHICSPDATDWKPERNVLPGHSTAPLLQGQ